MLPEKYKDFHMGNVRGHVCECFFAGPLDVLEPSSYEEAKGKEEWEMAMREEMSTLDKNETWELVPEPEGVQPISCKWVYRIKRKTNGEIDRYKARLVARGFTQNFGQDYEETFINPVAKMTCIWAVLAVAASKSWRFWQFHVKNALLY